VALKAPALLAQGPQVRKTAAREFLARAALPSLFSLLLAVASLRVSASVGVQTLDPVLHAFAARVYLEGGLSSPNWITGEILSYTSGFGAVNSMTVALAPLNVVQAVNLQHILWVITGVFLAMSTVAAVADRWEWPLPLLPVAFLGATPLYSLSPDRCYCGTPRQMAIPLLAATCLLPLLASVQNRRGLYLSMAVVAVLGVLAAAMNPACVPFAGGALLVGLSVLFLRGRAQPREGFWKGIGWYSCLILLASLVLLRVDRYYGDLMRRADAPLVPPAPVDAGVPAAITDPEPGATISLAAGLDAVRPSRLFNLSENATVTVPGPTAPLSWPEEWPYRAYPWVVLAGGLVVAGLIGLRKDQPGLPDGVLSLGYMLAGCGLVWLVSKAGILFLAGTLVGKELESQLLGTYLKFVLLRWELLLLFTAGCAIVLALYLVVREQARASSKGRLLFHVAAGGWVMFMVLAAIPGHWQRCGDVVMRRGWLTTTDEDLELVAWCNTHLGPEKGLIGMAATTFLAGPGGQERHLVGWGGAQAFLLFGEHGNYRFTLDSLAAGLGYHEYTTHVQQTLDIGWCLRNGIRYFYIGSKALEKNPGLAEAIAQGWLRLVQRRGESAVYEVLSASPGEPPV
jgi:hypothetical protein